MADFTLPASTRAALAAGQEKLNKYLEKAKPNHTYVIGTSMSHF
jgi:hypothetical protein